MIRNVEVAIIGAGSAGLSARREVAKKTENYVVIDYGKLGTTCARVGCMPSKVLIQAATDFDRRLKLAEQGIIGAENLSIDLKLTMQHVRKLRDRFVRAVLNDMNEWTGEKLIQKKATFLDENTIDCEGEIIKANKIIIASGSRPNFPAILNDYKDFLISTDEFFELEMLPESILVVGLGVIGLELGQALSRLGVKTFGVTRSRRLAGVSDPKLNDYVIEKFSNEFPIFFGGIDKINKVGDELEIYLGENKFKVKKILLASGRKPNLDHLNLECLKLDLKPNGVPQYNKTTFHLEKHNHIYIAGDVNGEKQILHEASDEGKIAGYNAVNPIKKFKTRTPLSITFCDPNIAEVGESYQSLIDKNCDFEIGEVSFEGQGRSIVKLKEIGMLRIYGDKKTGVLLGSEMFGPDCEHIAHLLSWAIEQKLTVNQALAMPFYHPVIEEGLRTALRSLRAKVNEKIPDLEIFPLE